MLMIKRHVLRPLGVPVKRLYVKTTWLCSVAETHFETSATTSDPDGVKCLQSERGGCEEQPPNLLSVDTNLRKRSATEHVTANQRATRPIDFKEKRSEE